MPSARLAFCSTTRMLTSFFALMRCMIAKISCTISGARPNEGSSSSSSFGRSSSARAIASICCSPPDSVPACWRRRSRSGEIAEHALEIGAPRRLSRRRVGAEPQILLDRQFHERAAAVRHVARRRGRRCPRSPAVDAFAAEADLALRADHAADGAQRGRLAGAVGAEQRGDAALRHREVDAVQHRGLAVAGVQARAPQAAPACAVSPR